MSGEADRPFVGNRVASFPLRIRNVLAGHKCGHVYVYDVVLSVN